MNWIWIVLIVIAGCAIINPILYFIYWEMYNRKEWIKNETFYENDSRFWRGESNSSKRTQIAPVRPQVKDVYSKVDFYWLWWFPVCSSVSVLFYICAIIARPFEKLWKWLVSKIANIKV